MQSALLVEGVRTLGTLEDRLDGAGFPSLPPADHEAFAVILDEVKRRKSPDQRELIIDQMAAALTPHLDPPHRPCLAGPVSDP